MTLDSRTGEAILTELRKITRILNLIATKDMPQKEKILSLSAVGLQPKEIAEIIGTTANTVSVTLSSTRRQTREKAKREG